MPQPGDDEVERNPAYAQGPGHVRSAPDCPGLSRASTGIRARQPHRQSGRSGRNTTDAQTAVSMLARAHGITTASFRRSDSFVNEAHVTAFKLFDDAAGVSQEALQHWQKTVEVTQDQVVEGGAFLYEEDQVGPMRLVLMHLARQLGIIRNQECLTHSGRAAVAALDVRYGKADMGVKVVSDLVSALADTCPLRTDRGQECTNGDKRRDRVSFEVEAKRKEVAKQPLDYIEAFYGRPNACLTMHAVDSAVKPMTYNWVYGDRAPTRGIEEDSTIRKAGKMLCQVSC